MVILKLKKLKLNSQKLKCTHKHTHKCRTFRERYWKSVALAAPKEEGSGTICFAGEQESAQRMTGTCERHMTARLLEKAPTG